MPSGRLAFATRRVDLMEAGMRATLALYAGGWPLSLPNKAWEKSTRWWFEFKERLSTKTLSPIVGYASMSSVLEAVWNSAQPKLTEIRASLSKGKRENPHIIRVGQLDSELLDQELAQLLKEPINKALSLISVCLLPNLANFKRLTHQYTKSRV